MSLETPLALLSAYAPPAALLSEQGELLHTWQNLEQYLVAQPDQMPRRIDQLVCGRLSTVLKAALEAYSQTGAMVRYNKIALEFEDVNVILTPAEGGLLLIIEPLTSTSYSNAQQVIELLREQSRSIGYPLNDSSAARQSLPALNEASPQHLPTPEKPSTTPAIFSVPDLSDSPPAPLKLAPQQQRRGQLAAVLHAMPIPILLINQDSTRVVFVNPAMETYTGHSAHTLQGSALELIFRQDSVKQWSALLTQLRAGEAVVPEKLDSHTPHFHQLDDETALLALIPDSAQGDSAPSDSIIREQLCDTVDELNSALMAGAALVGNLLKDITLSAYHLTDLRQVLSALERCTTITWDLSEIAYSDQSSPQQPTFPQKSPARRLEVMLVDDNIQVLRATCRLLDALGLQAHSFPSSREALDAFATLQPDLIFLDVWMPEIDGIELLSRIRAQNPEVPALLYSGDYIEEVEALEDERTRLLLKPFTREDLLKALKQVTGG